MPHDRNGAEIKEGDIVLVECEVKTICAGEEYCNLTVASVVGRKPDGRAETMSINAAVVELKPKA